MGHFARVDEKISSQFCSCVFTLDVDSKSCRWAEAVRKLVSRVRSETFKYKSLTTFVSSVYLEHFKSYLRSSRPIVITGYSGKSCINTNLRNFISVQNRKTHSFILKRVHSSRKAVLKLHFTDLVNIFVTVKSNKNICNLFKGVQSQARSKQKKKTPQAPALSYTL